eukprot:gnl/TRDRNA2_/TRDRNA2_204244_c0_seq1.p1 gnl/TRDRNA2_/TRDRNA2_204244_c0~~gnl/TRDRNA2_/TRDRNA2_204244_c0_seq1.p1  ORF type:complete len:216 (-),score=49.01 gnl/TRDRNA2_/TRDRNA2_204244_c0_seq1:99-746(-)
MPLIHIYLDEGKDRAYLDGLSEGLHEALMETWEIPLLDRFQIFHEMKPGALQIDKEMWDVKRSDDVVVFHIFTSPRTYEMKLALYKRLPEILAEKIKLRPEDVFISVSSNTREDWSFGNGIAQLLEPHAESSRLLGFAKKPASAGSGGRSFATLAGRPFVTMAARRPFASLAAAPRLGRPAGGAVGKLGLVAACGMSAFLGGLASQCLGNNKLGK